jgi:hypothetical protein
MAKRKSGALKSAKFPPPSPFRESENIDKANVAFGDLEFEAAIQDYVKDSPVALLALQDINKRGGISKFIKALQKGDKYYGTTSRGTFNPKTDEIKYNVTDVLDFLDPNPTKEQVEAANLVQSSVPTIAHELFHYGVNVLRKKGYDVPQGYIGRERGDPRISTDVENEEAIIDFLEKYQRKRTGEDEDAFEKSARFIGLPLKRGDRSEKLLGSFRSSGYSANESPFSLFQKGMYKRQESSSEALDRFEDMALDELKERNYARTKEPLKDTREKSFLEKLAGLNPFREKPRPMYKEGGVVNMLRKMK